MSDKDKNWILAIAIAVAFIANSAFAEESKDQKWYSFYIFLNGEGFTLEEALADKHGFDMQARIIELEKQNNTQSETIATLMERNNTQGETIATLTKLNKDGKGFLSLATESGDEKSVEDRVAELKARYTPEAIDARMEELDKALNNRFKIEEFYVKRKYAYVELNVYKKGRIICRALNSSGKIVASRTNYYDIGWNTMMINTNEQPTESVSCQ